MTALLIFVGLVVALLVLFVLSERRASQPAQDPLLPSLSPETARQHVTYLGQIARALSHQDTDYVAFRGAPALARRMREDRRRVILQYVVAIRGDFERLIALARVIALFSPEVKAAHEWERIHLTVRFRLRVACILFRMRVGSFPVEQITALNNMVSDLSVRIEATMVQLGERAALAAKIASSVSRNSVGLS